MSRVGDMLIEFDERRSVDIEPEVLTLTEKNGFVLQRERFNKRLAVEDTRNYKLVRRNDIAFNPYLLWAGAIAQNTIVDTGIISPLYPTFRVRDGFDPRYVARLLLSPELISAYDKIAFGSVPRRRRSSVADFLALSIPDQPPLNEQRKITEILDTAGTLQVRRIRALRILNELSQSTFLDMFGTPARNPLGWPIKKVGDLVDSANYGTSEKAKLEGDLPVLRMNNITPSGEVDLQDLKYMDRPTIGDRYLVRAGDILFNRTNSPDLVGKTAIYRGVDRLAYAGYLIRVRANKYNDPEYIAAFLNTRYAKQVLRNMCKSIIGMANINARELQNIQIPAPPLELQHEFAKRVRAIDELKATHRRHLREIDALYASLQHLAFRDELCNGAAD